MHDGFLGEAVVLAVVDDRHAEHVGVLDGTAHESVVLHAASAVGDGDGSGFAEGAGGGQPLSLPIDGDAAGGEYVDDGFALDGVLDELDGARVIGWRAGVGHADDGGETSGGGGASAGVDRFLVGLSGDAEVDVQIDQAGAGDKPAGVDDLGLGLLLLAQGVHDLAVEGEEIADLVSLVLRVDDATVLDPDGVAHGVVLVGRRVRVLASWRRRLRPCRRSRGRGRPCGWRCRW